MEDNGEAELKLEAEPDEYDAKIANVTVISKPLASKKTTSRLYKLLKKASKNRRTNLKIGVKPVQTSIRKGEKGIVVIAGDIRPMDSICHMPIICENKEVPFIFVPSKTDLGSSLGFMGQTQIVLIRKSSEYEDNYEKVLEAIQKAHKELY